jgi:hypothetical protein
LNFSVIPPGIEEEWISDTFHCKVENNSTFVVAMKRIFAERLLDILLRQKVNFSYLSPEIVLNAIAPQEPVKDSESTMLLHIGSESSLISVNGKNVQHVRMAPLAFDWVDGQISNSQQIPAPDTRKIKLEYVQKLSQSPARLTFVTYYIRQFANKMQQELKRSELFFCRKFNQSPIKRKILSGKCTDIVTFSEVIAELNANTKIETASQVMREVFGESIDGAKRDILSHNMLAYIGASSCRLENKTKLINLFSEDFKNQISFQRRHSSYMTTMVTLVFASLLGLKLFSQQVNILEFKKLALAKLQESSLDTRKYHEAIASEHKLRNSIGKSKRFSIPKTLRLACSVTCTNRPRF